LTALQEPSHPCLLFRLILALSAVSSLHALPSHPCLLCRPFTSSRKFLTMSHAPSSGYLTKLNCYDRPCCNPAARSSSAAAPRSSSTAAPRTHCATPRTHNSVAPAVQYPPGPAPPMQDYATTVSPRSASHPQASHPHAAAPAPSRQELSAEDVEAAKVLAGMLRVANAAKTAR
ncbi:hypothetical protein BD626DRAFT_597415, partial [Schizophyllum amplum]